MPRKVRASALLAISAAISCGDREATQIVCLPVSLCAPGAAGSSAGAGSGAAGGAGGASADGGAAGLNGSGAAGRDGGAAGRAGMGTGGIGNPTAGAGGTPSGGDGGAAGNTSGSGGSAGSAGCASGKGIVLYYWDFGYLTGHNPEMVLHVDSTIPETIALERIKVRYYLTVEENTPYNLSVTDCTINFNGGVCAGEMTLNALDPPRPEATSYLELYGLYGDLPPNEPWEIELYAYADPNPPNNDFDNDYSHYPFNTFTEWDRITLYIDDVLYWGCPP